MLRRRPRLPEILFPPLLVIAAAVQSAHSQAGANQPRPAAPVSIDLVAVDRDGRPVGGLNAEDFTVTVDNVPRRPVSVRHVSRGPGAAAAASLQAARSAATAEVAEPARNVVVIIDQTLMERGDEPLVVRAVGAFLDRLGLADRVAIVRVPTVAGTTIALDTDRPSAREELRRVVGQNAAPTSEQTATPEQMQIVRDPDKVIGSDREQVTAAVAADPTTPAPSTDQTRVREVVAGLNNVLLGLRSVPGRKLVVLLSAGLPAGWSTVVHDEDLRNLALAAVATRSVVYGVGLRSGHADAERMPDLGPIDTVSRMTGGTFSPLDKQPDRTAERLISALASCYTLGIDAGDVTSDGRRHVLRVETARKGLTIRAPAWVVATDEPEDSVVSLAAVEAQPHATPGAPQTGKGGNAPLLKLEGDTASAPANDQELALMMSRLLDYVDSYQRAFSAVVAEERYEQTANGRHSVLQSDFLLIRPPNGNDWVSFRDVFEVDRVKVRDRDERLKKLFLENPNPDETAQLKAIKAESARYNIGPERNVNVPLFPFRLLAPANRGHLHFSLGKTGQSDNVQTRLIEYDERVRPTLIMDPHTQADTPVHGWFVVDALTGAVTETVMETTEGLFTARFFVRYRRDPSLGLWVPAEMRETYTSGRTVVTEAQATYTNFRRFQVTTEEKLKSVK